jgi:hypothetical protein
MTSINLKYIHYEPPLLLHGLLNEFTIFIPGIVALLSLVRLAYLKVIKKIQVPIIVGWSVHILVIGFYIYLFVLSPTIIYD